MVNFPTSLDTLTNPQATDKINNPSHSTQHTNINDAVEALEQKIGVDGSTSIVTLDYLIKNPASGGGGHVQTANKGGTGLTAYN